MVDEQQRRALLLERYAAPGQTWAEFMRALRAERTPTPHQQLTRKKQRHANP